MSKTAYHLDLLDKTHGGLGPLIRGIPVRADLLDAQPTISPHEVRLGARVGVGKAEAEWMIPVLTGFSALYDGAELSWYGVPWRLLRNKFLQASWLDTIAMSAQVTVEIPEHEGVEEFVMGGPIWYRRLRRLPLIGPDRFRYSLVHLENAIRTLRDWEYVRVIRHEGEDFIVPTDKLLSRLREDWAA